MKPDQLPPEDLFNLQKEAYFSGDMKSVKEMTQIAKSRIQYPKPEDWQKVKDEIDNMDFPNGRDFRETFDTSSHKLKDEDHVIKTYKKWMEILGYEVELKYNTCPKCKAVRNQVIRAFNNLLGEVHEKWLKWHGKDVAGKELSELAEDIFAV